jgi:hypothetical protein
MPNILMQFPFDSEALSSTTINLTLWIPGVTCLNNISCSLEHTNLYMFDYRSNISDEIGRAFGIDFSKRRLRLNEIKNILASSKK